MESLENKQTKVIHINDVELEKHFSNLATLRDFDLNDSKTCKKNSDIADATTNQLLPQPFVMCDAEWSKEVYFYVSFQQSTNTWVSYRYRIVAKPVACYLRYLYDKRVSGFDVEVPLTQLKGSSFIKAYSGSAQVGLVDGISECENTLELTTGYNYTKEIKDEEITHVTQKLSDNYFYVYQNYMIYAFELIEYDYYRKYKWLFDSNGVVVYDTGSRAFMFLPVLRSDAFASRYDSYAYSTISFNDAVNYLMKDGAKRWQ
ncbi:hypothetical protein ACTA71_007438 [Dictyostelium dimigraforme]